MAKPKRSARGAVVITGSSTGIGQACALRLDSLGFRVFAGVRRAEDGERLAGEASDRLTPLIIDVTNREAIHAAAEQVESALGDGGLGGLVNNAGIAVTGPIEFIPIDELRQQLEVNVIGQVAVTQAFLQLLRKARGRIVNVSSVGGRVALPLVGPYTASKFALEAISDSLRRELMPWGISVSLLEPGSVATPIWEKGANRGDELIERMPDEANRLYGSSIQALRAAVEETVREAIPADEVAEAVAHALTAAKPKTRYPLGKGVKARIALSKLLPDRTFDRLIVRRMGLPSKS